MSEENVPADTTAMQAEEIIKAAIAWRFEQGPDPMLSRDEWHLYEACNAYGDKFKGVQGR